MIYKKKINVKITQQNKQVYCQYFFLQKPISHIAYQFLKFLVYFQILQGHQIVFELANSQNKTIEYFYVILIVDQHVV